LTGVSFAANSSFQHPTFRRPNEARTHAFNRSQPEKYRSSAKLEVAQAFSRNRRGQVKMMEQGL
jgi:hypothetical protein